MSTFRLLLIILLIIISKINVSQAQANNTGAIYEKIFKKETHQAEILKDNFDIYNINEDYFLSVTPMDKTCNHLSIF